MAGEKILVIDDEVDIAAIIKEALASKGYEVVTASSGEEGLKKLKKEPADLILLDVTMGGMSGYEVCQNLKRDKFTRFIPVIMLTALGQTRDKITGIEAGADDYVTKPFDLGELETRVRWTLKRTHSQVAANPLTGLPGNPSIEEEIRERIDKKKNFAVLYLDIDHFKSYNDKYGYAKGDEIIRITAKILAEAIDKLSEDEGFVGHVGGDDFILITSADQADAISSFIISRFDQFIPWQYSKKDRESKYIEAIDRKGEAVTYPLMTMSIACVTNEKGDIIHHAQVSERAAQLKRYAKSRKGSVCVKDRRANGE